MILHVTRGVNNLWLTIGVIVDGSAWSGRWLFCSYVGVGFDGLTHGAVVLLWAATGASGEVSFSFPRLLFPCIGMKERHSFCLLIGVPLH